MMYGVEVWSLNGGWKEIVKIQSRFCNKMLGLPRFAENSVAELELGNNSRRGT
jgi:hypothetical protein